MNIDKILEDFFKEIPKCKSERTKEEREKELEEDLKYLTFD